MSLECYREFFFITMVVLSHQKCVIVLGFFVTLRKGTYHYHCSLEFGFAVGVFIKSFAVFQDSLSDIVAH